MDTPTVTKESGWETLPAGWYWVLPKVSGDPPRQMVWDGREWQSFDQIPVPVELHEVIKPIQFISQDVFGRFGEFDSNYKAAAEGVEFVMRSLSGFVDQLDQSFLDQVGDRLADLFNRFNTGMSLDQIRSNILVSFDGVTLSVDWSRELQLLFKLVDTDSSQ